MLADLLGAEVPTVLVRLGDERGPFALVIGDIFLGEERVVLPCFRGLGVTFFGASPFESLVGLALAFLPLADLGVFPDAEGRKVFDLVGLFDGRPRFGLPGVGSACPLPSPFESLIGLASVFILLAGLGDFAAREGLPTLDLAGLCDGRVFALP